MQSHLSGYLFAKICTIGALIFCIQSYAATPTACTFYQPELLSSTFAGGTPYVGCAEFSAVLGRHGCKKVRGACPLCVSYPGDHLQMWLPDYFVEVTKHIGKSIFTKLPTGTLLQSQLSQAVQWQDAGLGAKSTPVLSDGAAFNSASSTFWQARILSMPYGMQVNTFHPLASSAGVGFPYCFLGISEFYPSQWHLNLADGPFALKLMPLGLPLCLNPLANLSMEAVSQIKSQLSSESLTGNGGSFVQNLSCALPVSTQEAIAKNSLPSSDALAIFRKAPAQALCMGSWGNLLPRSGWIPSDDPLMSAMLAAYKFQSLVGDMSLNSAIKLRSDDKWQIVYPPRTPSGCFKPETSLDLALGIENPVSRLKDELGGDQSLKDFTYVIAVWRKRETCEEPLSQINGWNIAHKAHIQKNQAVCAGMRLL